MGHRPGHLRVVVAVLDPNASRTSDGRLRIRIRGGRPSVLGHICIARDVLETLIAWGSGRLWCKRGTFRSPRPFLLTFCLIFFFFLVIFSRISMLSLASSEIAATVSLSQTTLGLVRTRSAKQSIVTSETCPSEAV